LLSSSTAEGFYSTTPFITCCYPSYPTDLLTHCARLVRIVPIDLTRVLNDIFKQGELPSTKVLVGVLLQIRGLVPALLLHVRVDVDASLCVLRVLSSERGLQRSYLVGAVLVKLI
jgi:hypothetical protein